MKILKMMPDDPRLTAYALGELEPEEMAAVEAAIKNDPAAQATVAQIRGLESELEAALAKEPLPFVVPPPAVSKKASARDEYTPRKFWRLPFYLFGGLAAACVVAVFVVQQRAVVKHDQQMAALKAEQLKKWKEAKAKEAQENAANGIFEIDLKDDNEGGHVVHLPASSTGSSDETKGSGTSGSTATGYSNDYAMAATEPRSTFGIAVDTASYGATKRFLDEGRRPPRDAVRIEEMVNYFAYRYEPPMDNRVFAASMEVADAPWNPLHRLVRIGLKGRAIPDAGKLATEQAGNVRMTIARDVNVQVAFNPMRVQSYRLIGYEKRLLPARDVDNDKLEAAEIGSGHTVTALYEVVLIGAMPAGNGSESQDPAFHPAVEEGNSAVVAANSGEMLTVKIRYKEAVGDANLMQEFSLADGGKTFAQASQDFKFAAAVASFGMMLRESPHKGTATFDSVLHWGEAGLGDDPSGQRREFIDMVKKARDING